MAEWVTLLLLVPAIIVPVVLLFGFTGCDSILGLQPTVLFGPELDRLEAKSGTIIEVTWHAFDGGPFQVRRTNLTRSDPTDGTLPPVTGDGFQDTGRTPATTYQYEVASLGSDVSHDWSAPKTVQTLNFEPAFLGAVGGDSSGWESYCLVQRIEPSRLLRSGTEVIITLLGSSASGASIDRIYISQGIVMPQSPQQPYDSANQPVKVYDAADTQSPKPVNTGEVVPLGPVTFTLDQTIPVLIAFDFTIPPSTSGISLVPVSDGSATAYYKQGTAEAAQPTRSPGYTPDSTLYFIQDIEVA